MASLLLVEFAAVDRFHRAILFPYAQGFARSRGSPCRWIRFAVPANRPHIRAEQGVGLEPEEMDRLCQVLSEECPDVIVFDMRPAQHVRDRAARLCPNAQIATLSEDAGEVFGETVASWSARVASANPDYGFEPANELARHLQPLPFVVLGRECSYSRPIHGNPLYGELDLSHALRRGGCAFCAHKEERAGGTSFSPRSARLQLEALARTIPPWRGRLAVRLLGEPALTNVETIAELVCDISFPRAALLIDGRSDALLRQEDALVRAAKRLQRAGHRLEICLVGAESFSVAELERMNKGLSPEDNLGVIAMLVRLERAHPRSFGFREHGGLSMILYTPWTTFDDLATNLVVAEACGLEPLCGKLLSSRLRLVPGLPMTLLAQEQGLTIEGYDDPLLDTASQNLYEPEVPWRFADPAVEALCRVLVRLPRGASGGDPLSSRVDELVRRGGPSRSSRVGLALELLSVAQRTAEVDPHRLLDAFDAAEKPDCSLSALSREPWAEGQRDGSKASVLLTAAGIKPVSKIEPVSAAALPSLIAELALPNPRVRSRGKSGAEVQAQELFFGSSAEAVERAVELTQLINDEQDGVRFFAHSQELAELLGYPACCARAFAHEPARARDSYAWLHLKRRMDGPEVVAAETNPCLSVLDDSYVPCQLECARTKALLEKARALLAQRCPKQAEELMQASCHPWVMSLSCQGAALELIPRGAVSTAEMTDPDGPVRFCFRAGNRTGDSEDLRRASMADELRIDKSSLIFYRGDRPVADLSLRAFVWWHRAKVQRSLWREVLTLRAEADREQPMERPTSRVKELARLLDRALSEGLQRGAQLDRALSEGLPRGAQLGTPPRFVIREASPDRLSLVLGEDQVELNVRRKDANEPSLFSIGPFAFSSPKGRPLHSPQSRSIVRHMANHLKGWLARHRGEGSI